MNYKKIIQLFKNQRSLLELTELSNSIYTQIYMLNYQTKKYILKVSGENIDKIAFNQSVINRLSELNCNIQKILFFDQIDILGVNKTITIMSYVEGESLKEYPSKEQSKMIIKEVRKMQLAFDIVSTEVNYTGPPTIYHILNQYMGHINDCFIKSTFIKLVRNQKFTSLLNTKVISLYYGDLWNENILFTPEQNEVGIIDIDPIFYSHYDMQPAQLFSAFFLLNSILNDCRELFDLDFLLSLWPEKLDKVEILYLMLVFPLTIGMMKEVEFQKENSFRDLYDETMTPLHQSIEYILSILELDNNL